MIPSPDPRTVAVIRRRVLAHYAAHRRDLPWRRGARPDPYAIWVCEIMAQQTRIDVMRPYWERWMARFPTPAALAAAPLDDVLAAWAGLGYYARARALHAAARLVCERHGGRLPDDPEALGALPGVGPYTTGAIASIAFGRRAAAVDGNVARIYGRLFGIQSDVKSATARRSLLALAARLVPARRPGDYNQGLFDLGATVCTPRAPACAACPLAGPCAARAAGGPAPARRRRGRVRELAREAALVRRGRTFLMCRRAPAGLMGGLWELPDPAALEAGGARLVVDRSRELARHTQKLSHRTIHHRVYPARLASRRPVTPAAPYDAARFTDPAALGGLAVSSATAALCAALAENHRWRTPTKP